MGVRVGVRVVVLPTTPCVRKDCVPPETTLINSPVTPLVSLPVLAAWKMSSLCVIIISFFLFCDTEMNAVVRRLPTHHSYTSFNYNNNNNNNKYCYPFIHFIFTLLLTHFMKKNFIIHTYTSLGSRFFFF